MHNSIFQTMQRAAVFLETLALVGGGFFARLDLFAQTIPHSAYAEMRWRSIGPFRGGWATAASGIADQPNTLYFGAAGGGIWKTNDAGLTWQPLMQHEQASSIGALAVALSDPNIVYVGTGQVTTRYDILAGNGVYRSGDAGKSWTHIGLDETEHIGALLIDPKNPDRVLVAAMGKSFASNPERGIYRTADGGKSWKQVLWVNNETGVVDMARDPENPSLVYAAAWQMRLHPWLDYFQPQEGPGSAIYKSEDGGEHWNKLASATLPSGILGRIGLAVPRGSGGEIVYASIIVQQGKSGVYRSSDAGRIWQLMNTDPELANPYFSRVVVAPDNADCIYVMGRSIRRSIDGGKHFTIIKGAPGGDDYHQLWINPSHPSYMITASDQGAAVTVNGGESWSDWYNQPTGQFYHLAADNRFPYRIYSGQQDNGTVSISSHGAYGVIEERDWQPAGGEERGYEIPKPENPDIVLGTGLGGTVTRADQRTRQTANVSPWPISSYAARPTTIRYRYTWITPLEYSPLGLRYLYFGAQVLFRSSDDGDHWEEVSPDLSGKKAKAIDCEKPDLNTARDCGFGTIFTIAPSPIDEKVLWIGTDDGLLHLTTDGCKSWKNVAPKTLPVWGLVHAIAPSHFSPHTAYAAVDLHRIGKSAPLLLKTSDDGQSWKTVVKGLPKNEYVCVVREDPVRVGLLYAGTNRGAYVSFDDGENWQPLSLNLPTTCVRDLLVHNNDLIAATQGRGIWILDNVEPLRELTVEVTSKPVHLFQPAAAYRVRGNMNNDTPPPPSTPLGENPPAGAMIDYWLQGKPKYVVLHVLDSTGYGVRKFSSDPASVQAEVVPAHQYFESGWLAPPKSLSAEQGMHRFVWDLRNPRPSALHYSYSIGGVWQKGVPIEPEGSLVLPGRYTVEMFVDENPVPIRQPLLIKADPRVPMNGPQLHELNLFSRAVDDALARTVSLYKDVALYLETVKNAPGPAVPGLIDSLTAVKEGGKPNLGEIENALRSLANALRSADGTPTEAQRRVYREYYDRAESLWRRWEKIVAPMKKHQ